MEYRIMRGVNARTGGEKEVEDIMLSSSHDLYRVLNENGWKRIFSDISLRSDKINAYMKNAVYVSPSLYCLSFPSYQNQIPYFDDHEIIDLWVKDDPEKGQSSEVDVFECIMASTYEYYSKGHGKGALEEVESVVAIPIDDVWREAMNKEDKQKDGYIQDHFNESIFSLESLSEYWCIEEFLYLPTAFVLPFPVAKGIKAEKCDASFLWFFGSAYYSTVSFDAYDSSKYEEYIYISERTRNQYEEDTFYCDRCSRTFPNTARIVFSDGDYSCEACAAAYALGELGRCYSDYGLFEKHEPLPDILEIDKDVIGILCTFHPQGVRVEAIEGAASRP
ncbi:MAG: hypothetical protein PHX79_01770 [Sphaerochaetaceae bacterium]|nr:hypothetical protein [Sphaerochaetaceae bacterium]